MSVPRPPVIALLVLVGGCSQPTPKEPVPPWAPGTVYQAARSATGRGWVDRRGLIHAHTPYSHDACDGEPRDGGVYDETCAEDFRRGLCQAKHDFAFLTDHPDSFIEGPYPDVLQYRARHGDVLVSHGAGPTASWMACPDGPPPLILAGAEGKTMPVGLDEHVAPTLQARDAVHGADTAEALLQLKAKNAVALVAHTENWTPELLVALPLDGFEMYNLHANTLKNGGVAADLLFGHVEGDFTGLPAPDAFFAAYVLEDPVYLERWGTTLARGAKRVTTLGTDCHRNTFRQLLQDGERVDSYRRMMIAFSNHLLVRPKDDGSYDDRDLKDALRAGRLYGVFEFMGYAQGFDFVAVAGGLEREMGETVSLAGGVTLRATMPTVQNLDPAATAPTLTLRLLRAKEGGWDEVASTSERSLELPLTQPGAYRAEVRMVPRHLRSFIGTRVGFIKSDRPWIYSNAVYVTP